MIWIYRILYIPIFLITFPYYLWRMLRRGGYGKDFHHRLGLIEQLPEKKKETIRIWIQAVSLGEVNAIKPLIDKLLAKQNIEIVLTTTTSTSYKIAHELYDNKITKVAVFPFDFWLFSATTWKRINPDIVILMEGELWPEHIHQATIRKVPILVINARLSDRSFKRYQKVQFLAKKLILNHLYTLLAGSQLDLERFIKIGMDKDKTGCTGNLKFDVTPKKILNEEEKIKLKEEMGFIEEESSAPIILMGSSTWAGEEALLIKIFEKALNQNINCRLLLVPRHAERKEEIIEILRSQEQSWHSRSDKPKASPGTYIYLADTTGELSILSQIADLAYIGKSLPPHNGGQTPIEGAALGIAMIYGPMMTNFKEVTQSLEKAKASIKCHDEKEIEEQILELLRNSQKREELGTAAKRWHSLNQGATDKTIEYIDRLIK